MRHGIIMAAMSVLTACAYWSNQEKQGAFERTSRAYEKAMEWSNYEALQSIVRIPEGSTPFDPKAYKDYKVTSYKPLGGAGSVESGMVRRTANISYVWLPRMSERSTTVEEVWEYSEQEKRWYLKSGLPRFQ